MIANGTKEAKQFSKRASVAALVAGTISLAAPGAFAQSVLQDTIVVTAQKRDQDQQDVGIAVMAYSGEQLRELGFTDSIDLIAQTPGLDAAGFGGGAIPSFNIRGVGQNDFAANQEAPVALYIDETYQSSNVTTYFSLFDIERAEVLRGPQGTLFGRNSTGGLVHYLTVKPSQEAEAFIDVTAGEQGRVFLQGAAGGGLSDTVSTRVSFAFNRSNGLLENDIGENAMRPENFAIRGQLLFEPTDTLSALLKVQYGEENGAPNGYSLGLPSFNPTDFLGNVDADGDPFTISTDFDFFKNSEVFEVTGTLNWDLGFAQLTSVTNFQDISDLYGEDADVTDDSQFNYTQGTDIQQFSQEVRLSFDGERHRSVLGLYFLNIDGSFSNQQFGELFFGPDIFETLSEQDTTTIAVFAQTEYDLTDQLALTLGARFNHDKKDFELESTDFGFPLFVDTIEESDWSGKVQLDYRPTDGVLLYAGVSRGIKLGGFNFPLTPLAVADLPFDSETLWAYEVGAKTELGDRARLNLSAFYYDYNDYQAYNIDAFFNTLLFNADAEFFGGEIEFVANPIDGLDILLGGSWTDTEVTGLPTDLNTLDPITFAPAANFPTGVETAPVIPEFSLNGLVRYSWTMFGGSMAVQSDFFWKDDHKFNLAVSEVTLEDAYAVLNASIRYTSESGRWSASVFGQNLTDTRYRRFAIDGTLFFGSSEDVFGEQRWFGGNVRINF